MRHLRRVSLLVVVLALGAHVAGAQNDSTWRDHDRAARDARLRGDWRGSLAHLERMDALLGGHPSVVLAMARAQARVGDTAASIATLDRLAAMGIAHDVATDTLLDAVRARVEGLDIARRLRENGAAVGAPRVVATMPDRDFVAEGIVWDPTRRRLLVSSIRQRRVVSVTLDGAVTPLVDLAHDGAWAGMGMAIDPARDRLWVATEWTTNMAGGSRADSGRSAVLRYALRRPGAPRRLTLPPGRHEPGDIAVASNGDLFVSDGREGMVFVVRDGRETLDTLVPPGTLVSPQGIAPDADGRRLFVADYVRGIAVVDRATGAVSWLPRPRDVAVNGVDGMILHGDALLGVQNGLNPDRVVALDLDRAHGAITGVRVLARDSTMLQDPTHLALVGDDLYFVANGGYDAYEADGSLRAGAVQRAPAVARLALPRLALPSGRQRR